MSDNNLHPYNETGQHPIQSMLEDTTTQVSPLAYTNRPPESASLWTAGAVGGYGMAGVGILTIISVQQISVAGVLLVMAGVIGAVFSTNQAKEVSERNSQRHNEDASNKGHLQLLERTRIEQRVPAMQTAGMLEQTRMTSITQMNTTNTTATAQVEVAKWEALAQSGRLDHDKEMTILSHDLENAEAEKVRNWQTEQNSLDRQATVEQMLVRFQGKINEMEVRLEFENPTAAKKIEEQLVIMRGSISHLEEINRITDPVMKKQMFDRFKSHQA